MECMESEIQPVLHIAIYLGQFADMDGSNGKVFCLNMFKWMSFVSGSWYFAVNRRIPGSSDK